MHTNIKKVFICKLFEKYSFDDCHEKRLKSHDKPELRMNNYNYKIYFSNQYHSNFTQASFA